MHSSIVRRIRRSKSSRIPRGDGDADKRGLENLRELTIPTRPRGCRVRVARNQVYMRNGDSQRGSPLIARAGDLAAAGGEVPSDVLGGLGFAHAMTGDRGEATKILKELQSLAKRHYVPPFESAKIYFALGRPEEALTLLEKSFEDRNWAILTIRVDPRFDMLRSHPRFQAIVNRMGFRNRDQR